MYPWAVALLAACAGAVYLLHRVRNRQEESESRAQATHTALAASATAATAPPEDCAGDLVTNDDAQGTHLDTLVPAPVPVPVGRDIFLSADPAFFPIPIPAADEASAADSFLALLTECESADASISITSVPTFASLTAALVARKNDSVQQAIAEVASLRSALLAHNTRVLGSAKRLARKQRKRIVADIEAADVSTEQLRVWAVVAGTGTACPDLDFDAALPLLASPRQMQAPVIGVGPIFAQTFGGQLGSVTTGDGLRVVSAAGPGLKWFEPHSRNEFSVVLVHADGIGPVWLRTGDVVVEFLSSYYGSPAAAGAWVSVAADVQLQRALVSVVYGGLSEDTPEATLQLYVCGVSVADAAGDCNWRVFVPRKPWDAHQCAAVGTHVRTLAVVEGDTVGMAVRADEKWLVVGLRDECTLSVYSLPECELVRTFGGGRGDGPLQFEELRRLCFASNGNLIVVDLKNKRLQEVTLEGVFVRFIGVWEFGDGNPLCVAVLHDVIAVGLSDGTGLRVVLFDFGTGAVKSRFGEMGTAPGQLSRQVTGIRFTPDGSHVVAAELHTKRLSLFTTAGVFVRCVGVGELGEGWTDVLLSASGEYVVADRRNQRVCVFSPDGSELVRSWGVVGAGDRQFQYRYPATIAVAGQHLYVIDSYGGRVQVFE